MEVNRYFIEWSYDKLSDSAFFDGNEEYLSFVIIILSSVVALIII
jgi:hypothetical protein